MSDVEKYISQRKKTDPEFAEGFEDGYREFEIDVLDIGEEEWLKIEFCQPASSSRFSSPASSSRKPFGRRSPKLS